MKAIAIIPEVNNENIIENKMLINVYDKPLLCWSIIQALQSGSVESVYVSSEDFDTAEVAQKCGAVPVKSSAENSKDAAKALLHVIKHTEDADAVVYLPAESPVREPADIKKALEYFEESGADSLFSAALLDDGQLWEEDEQGALNELNESDQIWQENGSIYIFKPQVLINYGKFIGGKVVVYPMEKHKSFSIKTLEDVKICEAMLKTLI